MKKLINIKLHAIEFNPNKRFKKKKNENKRKKKGKRFMDKKKNRHENGKLVNIYELNYISV